MFEVDCRVESKFIGDNNIVESKGKNNEGPMTYLSVGKQIMFSVLAFVGRQTSLSNGCVIGAKCEVLVPETLQEGSLFYGADSDVKRRVQSDKPSVVVFIQICFTCLHHLLKQTFLFIGSGCPN